MIDLHAHFLPSVDDGAADIEKSLQMLESSANQGVSVCAATPHCILHKQGDVNSFLERRSEARRLLENEIGKRGTVCPSRLLFGAEVLLDNNINEYSGIEKLCYEGTNYMLVELGADRNCSVYADWIYTITLKNIKPVLAHVDRYPFFETLMNELKGIEIIYQINASRFCTAHGRTILKKLFKYNNTYFVSSDMHNTTTRPCNMLEAYQKALKKFPENAGALFKLNAKVITEGQNNV